MTIQREDAAELPRSAGSDGDGCFDAWGALLGAILLQQSGVPEADSDAIVAESLAAVNVFSRATRNRYALLGRQIRSRGLAYLRNRGIEPAVDLVKFVPDLLEVIRMQGRFALLIENCRVALEILYGTPKATFQDVATELNVSRRYARLLAIRGLERLEWWLSMTFGRDDDARER